jgi:hypothetical protein
VAISTASGHLSTSSITTTELGYLSGVTSLIQGQLDNKTASGHTHSIANITNLQPSLDSKPPNSRVVATASGLTGGGDLSADRIISLDISSLTNKATPSSSDQVLIYDPISLSHRKTTVSGITSGINPSIPYDILLAASDESSPLMIGNGKITIRAPRSFTLTDVRASVSSPASGSTIIADLDINGSSILATKLSIDASEKSSTTAAIPVALTSSPYSIANDDEIAVDILQVGSAFAGRGLKVSLIGRI